MSPVTPAVDLYSDTVTRPTPAMRRFMCDQFQIGHTLASPKVDVAAHGEGPRAMLAGRRVCLRARVNAHR